MLCWFEVRVNFYRRFFRNFKRLGHVIYLKCKLRANMARTKSYHYAIADDTSLVKCGKDVTNWP